MHNSYGEGFDLRHSLSARRGGHFKENRMSLLHICFLYPAIRFCKQACTAPSGHKKTGRLSSSGFLQRRGRDSNPRILSDQRFSRPPQSTTLPPLQYHCFRFGIANVRIIFTNANFYCIFLKKKRDSSEKSLQNEL